MEKLIEYLVIEQIKDPATFEVVATHKFVTPDKAYTKYKAKPTKPYVRHGQPDTPTAIKVFYKIKVLKGIRAIRKHKKLISGYNSIK